MSATPRLRKGHILTLIDGIPTDGQISKCEVDDDVVAIELYCLHGVEDHDPVLLDPEVGLVAFRWDVDLEVAHDPDYTGLWVGGAGFVNENNAQDRVEYIERSTARALRARVVKQTLHPDTLQSPIKVIAFGR